MPRELFLCPTWKAIFLLQYFCGTLKLFVSRQTTCASARIEVGMWWVVFCPGSKQGNVGGTEMVAEV